MSATCPRCGTPNATGRLSLCPVCVLDIGDEDPSLPEIPGLTLEQELGRGGMGRVFRARHAALERAVAVKVLAPETAFDPDFRARFEREARTLARLDHPGIVRVHDFGATPAGDPYLVLELVSGGTLAEKIPAPVERSLGFVLELCAALAHAHEQGVIHRDIKPANVLLTPEGALKLTDFGIARLFDAGAVSSQQSSRIFGTPRYMAPEALTGALPNPKFDVYAAGVLLHELVTGKLPGDGALLPPAVQSVVRRATAIDPEQRTESVRALASDVRDALRRLDERGAPGGLPEEERVWVAAVALLHAVAAAVALYAFVVSFTPRVLSANEALPMIAFGTERLPDGSVVTRARFEVWPVLGAALAFAVAQFAYGLLRRHWRHAGLDQPTPEKPLRGSRTLLGFGVALLGLFFVRELLARGSPGAIVTYIPVLGGVVELWMLYVFFAAVLESLRTRRALKKEPLLWLGLVLALVPPSYHFLAFLRNLE